MGEENQTGVVASARSPRTYAALIGASALMLAPQALAQNAGNAAEPVQLAMADSAEQIVVTGERDRIHSLNSRLGELRDAPQSISVIPRAVIEQQNATTLRDVLRNVSGISLAAGEGGVPAGDNLTLRGFSARTDIFIDGIRDFGSYTRDTFNVEQVEVVKGPSSAQTGRGSTGGYINLISKQPQLDSFVGGTVGLGTPDYLRVTGDVNVGGEDLGIAGAAVRLNLMYQDADTPGRDHVGMKRWGVAPSIALGLGTSTRAILSYLRLEQENVPDYGIPFVPAAVAAANPQLLAERPAPVDYSNYYGLLARDYEDTLTNVVTFAVEHDLSDAVRISNVTRYGHSTRDSIYSAPRFAGTTLTINADAKTRDTVDEIRLNQTNIFADFATGGLRHDLIAGVEIAEEKSRNRARTASAGPATDLYNPDPWRPYEGMITPGATTRAKADSLAAYVFDTVHLSDQWLLSGGLRLERFDVDYVSASSLGRTDDIFSWRAGLTYKPVPSLSLYAGAGSSANPSFEGLSTSTVSAAQAALKPEKSHTYEVGAKWDGLNGKLLLTGALFRIDKVNARTPSLAGDSATVLEGKQRVDGIELGATGRLTKNWELVAAYTYLDSEIRESNTPAEVGKQLLNTPRHSGSIWTTYNLPFGLEIGGGVRYVGKRYTSNSNTRAVDDYWLADATIAHDLSEQASLRLNVFNIFDEKFEDSISGGHFVPGLARSAVVTLAFRY